MTRGEVAARRTARRLALRSSGSGSKPGGGGGELAELSKGLSRRGEKEEKGDGVGPAPMQTPFAKADGVVDVEGGCRPGGRSPRRCSDIDGMSAANSDEVEEAAKTFGSENSEEDLEEISAKEETAVAGAASKRGGLGRKRRRRLSSRARLAGRMVSGEEEEMGRGASRSRDVEGGREFSESDEDDDGTSTPSISSAVTTDEEESGNDNDNEDGNPGDHGGCEDAVALEAPPSRTRTGEGSVGIGVEASSASARTAAHKDEPCAPTNIVLGKIVGCAEVGAACKAAEENGGEGGGVSSAAEGIPKQRNHERDSSSSPSTVRNQMEAGRQGGRSTQQSDEAQPKEAPKEPTPPSKPSRPAAPPLPNPLHDPNLLRQHVKTLRLESQLLPLRPVLSRLMVHAQHNRRGTFNAPVDARALNLPDYDLVITNPMDLGTVKARLHASSYGSHEDVASDVRLTFRNAMTYNPPGNPVHDAARALWELFEEGYAAAMAAVGVDVGPPVLPPPPPPPAVEPQPIVEPQQPPAPSPQAAAAELNPLDPWSIAMKLAGELASAGSRQAQAEVMRPAFSGKTLPGASMKPKTDISASDCQDDKTLNGANGTSPSEAAANPQQPPACLPVGDASAVTAKSQDQSQDGGPKPSVASGAAQQPGGDAPPAAVAPQEVQTRPPTSVAAHATASAVAPQGQQAAAGSTPAPTSAGPLAGAGAAAAPTTAASTRSSSPDLPPLPLAYRSTSSLRPTCATPPQHSCPSCLGRTCALCERGCLPLEPTLLICSGSQCRGTKIRRGAVFYAASDGTKQWCQRCYSNLSAIIPDDGDAAVGRPGRYKRDLLKRRNDEEVVEGWATCSVCRRGVHHICAMYNDVVGGDDGDDFVCPLCSVGLSVDDDASDPAEVSDAESTTSSHNDGDFQGSPEYTFVSGSELPQRMRPGGCADLPRPLDAKSLPECAVSSFIQKKIQERMMEVGCPPNAERTLLVRVISDYEKDFQVPDVIRRHFRMETVDEDLNSRRKSSAPTRSNHSNGSDEAAAGGASSDAPPAHKRRRTLTRSSSSLGAGGTPFIPPPSVVTYQSKAIALFQRIDGVDVCVFCMYVQEYSGDETTDDGDGSTKVVGQRKRVYIAYLDSVEHFRPRSCRTDVYQEILVSYLASARARGYEMAHIWACPPARGNSFVFWSHPSSQKTPTRDRLTSWYHGSLSRALECGVVTNVSSLYEHSFQRYDKSDLCPPTFASATGGDDASSAADAPAGDAGEAAPDETIMVCPPLLDGDLWVEEAVRAHSASIARHLKNTSSLSKPAGASTSVSIDGSLPIHAPPSGSSCCPAIQVADLLHKRILAHPSSMPFRRPVNAAALKLKDYHDVIKKPMDLGTVHSRILLGEFDTVRELVADVELVFSNAMRYNPKGHFVYGMAVELREFFFRELGKLANLWSKIGVADLDDCKEGAPSRPEGEESELDAWKAHSDMSMRLSTFIDLPEDYKDKSYSEGDDAESGTGETGTSAIVDGSDVGMEVAVSAAKNAGPTILTPCASQVAMTSSAVVVEAGCSDTALPKDSDANVETTRKSEPVCDSVASSDAPQVSVEPQEMEVGPSSTAGPSVETKPPAPPATAEIQPMDASKPPAKRGRETSKQGKPAPPSKRAKKANPKPRSKGKAKAPPPPKLELLTDGPDAVAQKMVGEDYWLFDKNTSASVHGKGKKKKRKKSKSSWETDATLKKRKESWLGDEVGSVIRKMRRDFFVCDLTTGTDLSDAEKSMCTQFAAYASAFDLSYSHGCAVGGASNVSPGVADARHALLEFSQYRNFQFDTLRRAKYSTAMLLYHLHHADAPGLVPACGSCGQDTLSIRWHRIKKSIEERRGSSFGGLVSAKQSHALGSGPEQRERAPEELCEACYSKSTRKEDFIPIRVCFERRDDKG